MLSSFLILQIHPFGFKSRANPPSSTSSSFGRGWTKRPFLPPSAVDARGDRPRLPRLAPSGCPPTYHCSVLPPTIALLQRICPSKPDVVLAFHAGLGLSGADVAALVAKDPQFLYAGVESNLRPAAVGLIGLGLSRSELARLVSICPAARRRAAAGSSRPRQRQSPFLLCVALPGSSSLSCW
ncbi:hypothetical protein ZWY2020_043619 [Hordeum vulgare]|nr:hypothetical protein ZWY2020_043619 [Hordeum vulgare]